MQQTHERDVRLDFCRGLALIVIFIDHVPGNPLSAWTLRNFSFCDAAEVFVLISGLTTYLAYESRLSRFGLAECARAVWRNCLRIYAAHLLMIGVIAALMLWAAQRFSGADYIDSIKLQWLVEDPTGAIFAAATLRYLPRLMDILPLYLILLTLAPLLIAGVKRDYQLVLLGSGVLYLMAWRFGWNLSADKYGRQWYFDPFAWQFLYVLGLTISHLNRHEPDRLPWNHRWLKAALAFLAIAALVAWPLNELGLTTIGPLSLIWPADKTLLAPARIINVVALLYVFAFLVRPNATWLKRDLAQVFISCGKHSLPIYALGIGLSCVGYLVVQESSARDAAYIAVNILGVSILTLTALALDRRDAARRMSVPASAARIRGSVAA